MYKLKLILNKTISTKNTYLLAIIVFSFLFLVTYFSYAMFTVSKEKSNVLNIVAGNLQSYLESSDALTKTDPTNERNQVKIEVNANEYKEATLTISNFNTISAKFNLVYDNQNNVQIGYTSDSETQLDSSGSVIIDGATDAQNYSTKKIKVLINNNNDSNVTVTFVSSVGLSSSTIAGIDNTTLVNNLYNLSYPQAPELITGMIPVVYNTDKNNWVKADTSNNNWYNYKNGNWANVVLVNSTAVVSSLTNINGTTTSCASNCTRDDYKNAKAGTIINNSDINSMYVWIPKYEYKYSNLGSYDASNPGIININFITNNSATANYKIPSAFSGNTGFWFAKYKASNTLTDIKLISNNEMLSNTNIGDINTAVANIKSTNSGNYGLDSSGSYTINIPKNDAWGAVSYLSQSYVGNYFKNRSELFNNNSTTTGCSSGAVSAGSGSCANAYNTDSGQKSSTSGTVYGVYDMSGGIDEAVMATSSSENNTYFSNLKEIDSKYYNLYSTDVNSACNSAICYSHALSETNTWYNDQNEFLTAEKTWLTRGGNQNDGAKSGIFSYKAITLGNEPLAFRTIIIP